MRKIVNEESYTFTKENVSLAEYRLHSYIYNLEIVNVPKVYDYNKDTKVLKMQKIQKMCISDFYGEKPQDVPEEIFDKIRNIVRTLRDNDIEYPDITGYNFIEQNDKIWIIDFGHASFSASRINNDFIEKFLEGENMWNPEFI